MPFLMEGLGPAIRNALAWASTLAGEQHESVLPKDIWLVDRIKMPMLWSGDDLLHLLIHGHKNNKAEL